ncbi:MAG: protein translocase SEC61 complex subunit gamma [Candidatus Diapherotrites archaeon]|nr:protein translocase SEC61 complex subunit gamma [Candidatus Diapherotrites archaeon]
MSFINEAVRVLRLTRKPRKDEFIMISKITGIGMILIGVLGVAVILFSRLIGLT